LIFNYRPRITDYEQALATLRGSRDRLDRLARTLLDRETLEEDEAYAAAGMSPGTTTAPGNPPAAAQAGADHIAPAPSR
jgi:cell division protease FtsH